MHRLAAAAMAAGLAVSVLSMPAAAQGAPPGAPAGLVASQVAHDSVTLSWDDPGDVSITHYQVLRRDIVNQAPGAFTTISQNTGSAATSYVDDSVEPSTRYAYRVVAVNAAGASGRSGYVNVDTPAAPDPVEVSEPAQEPAETPAPAEEPVETAEATVGVSADAVSGEWGDITAHGSAGSESAAVGGNDPEAHTYSFSVTDVRHVRVSLTQTAANTDLYLEQSDGTEIDSDDSEVTDRSVSGVLRAGSYRVRVAAREESSGSFNLAYDVSGNISEAMTGDDFSADSTTLGRIQVGGKIEANISFNDEDGDGVIDSDRDWIGVQLERGVEYTFVLRGFRIKDESSLLSTDIGPASFKKIAGADGQLQRRTPFQAREISWTAPSSGLYFLDIENAAPWMGSRFSLAVVRMHDEYAANTSTTGRIEVGGSVESSVDWVNMQTPRDWDKDWFAVEFEAEHVYQIDLVPITIEGALLGRLPNADIPPLRDQFGYEVSGPWRFGLSLRSSHIHVQYTAERTGTHYIIAQASRYFKHVGHYRLSVSDITPPPPPPPPPAPLSPEEELFASRLEAVVVRLEVGVAAEGRIDDAVVERDWYQVDLVGGAGALYWLELVGSEVAGNTLDRPCIDAVFTGDGDAVFFRSDDPPEWSSQLLQIRPAVDATYFIVVCGEADADAGIDGTGSYSILVSDMAPLGEGLADVPGDHSTTAVLGVGLDGRVRGVIGTGLDVDCYRVELDADTVYRFDMEGAWGEHRDISSEELLLYGTLQDPLLTGVFDSAGVLIDGTSDAANNDRGWGKNSQIRFTATRSGTHYVCGASHRTWTGTFRLAATVVERLSSQVWSGVMSVGVGQAGGQAVLGYSYWTGTGALDVTGFELDGVRDSVQFIGLIGSGSGVTLALGLMREPASDLTLELDGTEYALAEATKWVGGSRTYQWIVPESTTWEIGDQINARLLISPDRLTRQS